MRRRVFLFISIVVLSLLTVPLVNILAAPTRDAIKWNKKAFLYNMDFASRWVAKLLYPWGISANPKQMIIGNDGWLYLGDQYEQTLSVDRTSSTNADMLLVKKIGAAADAWDDYLSSKGVKLFRIMIGPNKGSIYPEHMPAWAKPASFNATDALLAGTGNSYIDLRPALLAAKAKHTEALYYKTDTHWNSLGAGTAFRAFAHQISKLAPELQWPQVEAYELSHVVPHDGGDLASFLRLTSSLFDSEPIIHASRLPIETTITDFDTNQLLNKGGNPPVFAPTKLLLVKSEGALNAKKVLWLRDSFGTALSPLMAATFSEVLQLHWNVAISNGRFAQLVEEWKPDYVFVTVVERSSRNLAFTTLPPPALYKQIQTSDYKPIRTTTALASNHLLKGRTNLEYEINGNDPFVEFALSAVLKPSDAPFLSINLVCDDASPSVPLQLFWQEDGHPNFDEEYSARFLFHTGQQNFIDLHSLPKWRAATAIRRIRLDIDAINSCTHFKLFPLSLGVNAARN